VAQTAEVDEAPAWRAPVPLALTPILTAALDAFYDNGYHATSVRDIARRVQVTVPALYYHHENKEALLVELLNRSIDLVTDLCLEALDDAGEDPELRFCNLVESLVLFMTMSTKTAYLDHEIRALSTENRRGYAAKRRRIESLVVEAIAAGVAAGIFDVSDAAATGRALLGMIQSVAFWFRPGGQQSPEQLAATYLDLGAHLVGAQPPVIERVRARAAAQR
jgi:AcrR family transcriptional regulator